MIFQNVRIKSLRLICFAGKKDLAFELDEKTNVFIGKNCCGKTTLCDFIRFMFYGTCGNRDLFPWDGTKTVSGEMIVSADGSLYKIFRSETLSDDESDNRCVITDPDGAPLGGGISPGGYFLNLDPFVYDRTIYFPQKQNNKIQADTDVASLDVWGESFSGKQKLYSSRSELEKEKSLLMNDSKTGELDILLNERLRSKEGSKEMDEKREEYKAAEKNLEEINNKIASNNKRIVILKADMKNYTDDIKLTENRENASSLKSEIKHNEKKIKYLSFEAQNALPGMTRDDIANLSDEYLEYSRLSAELSDASAKLETANENYAINSRLFSEDSRDEIEDTCVLLENKRKIKNLFTSFGTLFVLMGIFIFCYLYFLSQRELLFSGLIAGAVFVFALIMFVCASVFRHSSEKILSEMNLESQSEFDELYEQYMSFKASDGIYTDAVENARAEHLRIAGLLEEKLLSMRRFLENKRLSGEDKGIPSFHDCNDSELLSRIDVILSKYNTLFETEDSIENQKRDYRQLLSRDVHKETLEVSSEFAVLEKELAFITKQNSALFSKQSEAEERLKRLKAKLEKKDENSKDTKVSEADVISRLERYRDLQISCDELDKTIAELEDRVLQPISARVNALMSFALKSGESFILSENFEFKYKRGSQTMPFSRAGGGLSELALIALRIAFSEQLTKGKVPMIFDESFMFIDKDSALSLCRIIEADGRQIIFCSSSESDHTSAFASPKMFLSEDFGSSH